MSGIVSIIIGALTAIMFWFGLMNGYKTAMQQAHERGYAVECVGQTGYHWECEK